MKEAMLVSVLLSASLPVLASQVYVSASGPGGSVSRRRLGNITGGRSACPECGQDTPELRTRWLPDRDCSDRH